MAYLGSPNGQGGMSPTPPAPPDMPSLSAFPVGKGNAFRSAAIPRIVFDIQRKLDDLVSAVPGSESEVTQIKELLTGILDMALQSSATTNPVNPEAVGNL